MTGFTARASYLALMVGALAAVSAASPAFAHESTEHACAMTGRWVEPGSGDLQAHDQVIEAAVGRSIVMLGETHPNVEHHRWQLSVIGALHGRNPNMVLGFEAFPRAVQPVLDRWVAGELSEEDFLRESNWTKNWGFDPELYLPMFHFARLHRVPMVALNVERDFVSRIRDEGLEAIPENERRGLAEPAAPSDAYLDSLADVFSQHLDVGVQAPSDAEHGAGEEPDEKAEETAAASEEAAGPSDDADPVDIQDDPRFKRFVRVQTTWDGAMAQALAEASAGPEAPLVVGVLGTGHLEKGYGVPFQLTDLGVDDTAVFIPAPPAESCEDYRDEVADALFVLPNQEEASGPSGPRLGVMIEMADDKVRVLQVMDDSVAEAADIRDGDAILQAAGVMLKDTSELIGIVQQQSPGTWLPLEIERDGETMEIVAKFPTLPNGHAKP